MKRLALSARALSTCALSTCALLASLCSGAARAASLEFGVGAPPYARVGVSGLPFAGGEASLGLSSRALGASFSRGLDFSVLGTANATLSLDLAFSGGGRIGLAGSGTLGPVALNLSALAFAARARTLDPLAESDFLPVSSRESGFFASANARYRFSRDLILLGSGELGAQPSVALSGEFRRGDLSYRVGGRLGDGVAGALVGATLRRDDLTFAADALLGPHNLGLTGSLTLGNPLPTLGDSSLRAYAAYEPWRADAQVLRLGADLSFALGRGSLTAEVRGGSGAAGVRLGYSLPLGPPSASQ